MDRKSLVVLAVSFLLLMLWYPLVNRLFPPVPRPPEAESPIDTNATTTVTAWPDTDRATPEWSAAPTPIETPLATVPTSPPAGAARTGALRGPELTLALETDQARYIFTSYGGGLKHVELKQYPEKVGRQARRRGATDSLATLNAGAPHPVFGILGSDVLPADTEYRLTRWGDGVRAEAQLESGLFVIKEFLPDTNYLLRAAVRIENQSPEAMFLPAQEWVMGTATPINTHDDGRLIRMQWFDGNKDHRVAGAWFDNRTLGCIPGTPRTLYQAGNSNVVWASAQNQFFAMIAIPPTNAPGPEVRARRLLLPPPPPEILRTDRQAVAKPFAIQTTFYYPETTLMPGARLDRWFDLFAGPKEYRTLDRLSSKLGNEIARVMDFRGFFGFFAKALLLSMNGLHNLGLSYGLAIVVITIIIKLLFWPLTQVSTRSMKRMQKLQPEMKALQEKYKDDPKKMNERMMAFMKEHRINPAAGCLPIVIQIPVFFGFYRMLQSAIELRGATFLWAFDLSQPDTIWVLPGLGFPLNPLPIIMGLTQFWQMRLTPPSPGMDPVQQKIFQFMPLMFLFILYNFSSGLTLYWTVQNLLTIAQMKLTRSTGEPEPAKPTAPLKGGTKPKRVARREGGEPKHP
jgi:YidC/Oxa1 family membrane protein insertase